MLREIKHQPLRAPSIIPLIKYFCMLRKMISSGIRDRMMVAVSVPYCQEAASSRRKVMPTGSVCAFAVAVRVLP